MAYCRIDVLEDGEEDLLKTLYLSAVAYLAGADISEPEADTPRRAQYDLCVNALVLDAYDKRGTTVSGSALTDNREYRGTFLQLQATEPVSESDTIKKGAPGGAGGGGQSYGIAVVSIKVHHGIGRRLRRPHRREAPQRAPEFRGPDLGRRSPRGR